jgi:uncharacterized protein (TIGR00251 family)
MKTKKKISLSIKVHPKSRKQEIKKLDDDSYIIHVTSPPSRGEANEEVRKLIARHFAIPVSKVVIARGRRSPYKLITIEHD